MDCYGLFWIVMDCFSIVLVLFDFVGTPRSWSHLGASRRSRRADTEPMVGPTWVVLWRLRHNFVIFWTYFVIFYSVLRTLFLDSLVDSCLLSGSGGVHWTRFAMQMVSPRTVKKG